MQYTIFDTPVLRTIMPAVSRLVIRLLGWKREGALPDIPKYVVIAAPHTSNIDLVYTLLYAFAFRVKIYWMGKHSIFKRPFGPVMKWLGGIPIDRDRAHNVVEESIAEFGRHERLALVVAPEGTRRKVNYWKTGFYRIAHGAGVPIAMSFLDYGRKTAGFGPTFMPTGDIEKDMEAIQGFYSSVRGRNPSKMAVLYKTAILKNDE